MAATFAGSGDADTEAKAVWVANRHHHRVGGACCGWYRWRRLSSDGTTATGRARTVAAVEPSSEPAEETTPEPTGYTPKQSDWVLKVKIKDKQCFGSVGCNVTAKITPYYDEPARFSQPSDEGVIELTYKVTGDESGPITGTLEIDCADQTNEIGEESMSTRSSATEVKATVTDVEYSEYG